MKLISYLRIVCFLFFVLSACPGLAQGADEGQLRAAAAKIDITPEDPSQLTNQWGVPFVGVHDRTYARVLLLNNGENSAVIIAIDTVEVADATDFVARLSRETGIPTANIVMVGTHAHNAPIVGMVDASGMHPAGPGGAAFLAKLHDDLVKAVKQGQADLQPVRLGVATGAAYINVNRDAQDVGRAVDGSDPLYPSDKTVWVLKVEDMSGEPIAFLINYAMHNTIIGMKNNLLTGEAAEVTSRYVEQYYDDKPVALWTMGAAGDQGPIVSAGRDNPSNFEPVNVLGQILGQEVVRVSNNMDSNMMVSRARIWGMEQNYTCPGHKDDGGGPNAPGGGPSHQGDPGGGAPAHESSDAEVEEEAEPATFRVGVIMVGDIALTEVQAEVLTNIYLKVREQSPFENTIMLTMANGRIGYIPDDAAYDLGKREAGSMAAVKKGCGEACIVNGLLDMMRQYQSN